MRLFFFLGQPLGGNAIAAATMGRHRAHPPAAGALGEGEAGVVRRRRRPARAPAHLHQPRPAGNHSVQLLRAALCKFFSFFFLIFWPLCFYFPVPPPPFFFSSFMAHFTSVFFPSPKTKAFFLLFSFPLLY